MPLAGDSISQDGDTLHPEIPVRKDGDNPKRLRRIPQLPMSAFRMLPCQRGFVCHG